MLAWKEAEMTAEVNKVPFRIKYCTLWKCDLQLKQHITQLN